MMSGSLLNQHLKYASATLLSPWISQMNLLSYSQIKTKWKIYSFFNFCFFSLVQPDTTVKQKHNNLLSQKNFFY